MVFFFVIININVYTLSPKHARIGSFVCPVGALHIHYSAGLGMGKHIFQKTRPRITRFLRQLLYSDHVDEMAAIFCNIVVGSVFTDIKVRWLIR